VSSATGQARCGRRLRWHLLSQLVCLGRHTVTGLLCTEGRQFEDWSADYRLYSRDRIDTDTLFATVREGVEGFLSRRRPLVVAMDDSLLRKRGRKVAGTGWRRDPLSPPFGVNFVWGQRVVQLSAALPLNRHGAVRMIPIDFVQAPTAVRPRPKAPAAAWAAYERQRRQWNINLQGLRRIEHLQRDRHPTDRPLWLTVDGRFTNGTLLRGLPQDVTLIGRIRADARLYRLPQSIRGSTGGRPRCYGDRLPTPEQIRQDEAIRWQTVRAYAAGKVHDFRIKTIGPLRWRAAGGQQTLRLIVIAPLAYRLTKQSKLLYRKPAYLICTRPDLPLRHVLQAYLWRWDIEVNLRDEKTLLGVGQAQVRDPRSVQNVPATAVAAYAMLLLAAAQAFGPTGIPEGLPLPAWRKNQKPPRASTMQLINQLRWELWGQSIKGESFSHFPTRLPSSHKPQKPPPDLASSLFYAIAG